MSKAKKTKTNKSKRPAILEDISKEKLIKALQGRVAVYIDAANLEKSVQH